MIRHRQCEIGTTHLAAGKTKPLKCLRTRHFMNEMPVDKDKASAIIAAIHDMGIPDFFVKSQRSIHARLLPSHEEMIKKLALSDPVIFLPRKEHNSEERSVGEEGADVW